VLLLAVNSSPTLTSFCSVNTELAAKIRQQMAAIPGMMSFRVIFFISEFYFNMWSMLIQASKVGI
jgi:hypothetical protein